MNGCQFYSQLVISNEIACHFHEYVKGRIVEYMEHFIHLI